MPCFSEPAPRLHHVQSAPALSCLTIALLMRRSTPATLNDQTVTLRLDARYIPIAIAWDSTERKVRIRPQELLALLRTHTVRLGSGITSRSGVPLAKEYSWQFKTSGVRLPDLPAPADGTEEESPFVRLAWRETGAIPGVTSCSFYESVDSA